MKSCHSEFVAEDGNGGLLSSDELNEMADHVKKRQGFVNLTIKSPYSKDGKRYMNLENFEWVAE